MFFVVKNLGKKKNYIKIKIFDENNKILICKKIENLFKRPFSSKLIFVKKILKKKEEFMLRNRRFFIKLEFNILNIFGRLIVGNYCKADDALYLTHTFNEAKGKYNYLKKQKDSFSAYLPLINIKPLKMTATSYPTSAPCKAEYEEFGTNIENRKLIKISNKKNEFLTGGKNSKIFEKTILDTKARLLTFSGKIPDRVNVEYSYFLENSKHPTDIADGLKTCFQPRKRSHWGHGIANDKYQNYILICNFANNKKLCKDEKIEINIFSNKKNIKKKVLVKKNSFKTVRLSNLKKILNSNYFSWYTLSSKTNLNIYWVSFNPFTGSICGDHAL